MATSQEFAYHSSHKADDDFLAWIKPQSLNATLQSVLKVIRVRWRIYVYSKGTENDTNNLDLR